MNISANNILELWRLQENRLSNDNAVRIAQTLWFPPALVVLLPMMLAKFSRDYVFGGVVASLSFCLYSFVTLGAWRLYSRQKRKTISSRRLMALLFAGYDCLLLAFLSCTLLATAILIINYLPFETDKIAIAAITFYFAEALFFCVWSPQILKYTVSSSVPFIKQSQTQWVLGIQSTIIGVALISSAIFYKIPFRTFIASGLVFIGSLVLLPFAIILFYQILVIVRTGIYNHISKTV
jgi:hypothetical protein